ncbi:MAG: family 78 glycoside hydrolase catalytic domain [Clostridia bacterium]|nr:family 78 glycoside hydrolase catalytic domain [Clostridia bacterium]
MKNMAKWITSPIDPEYSVVTFQTEFFPKKEIKKATVHASAIGVYTFSLNGARVGKGVLAPGWTSYPKRVQYQTYDVTDALKASNTLSFGVGSGWAVGHLMQTTHSYRDQIAFIAWMDVVYADGTSEAVATDASWDVYTNEVLFAEIYNGETVDKTAEIRHLGKAVLAADIKTRLVAQEGEWIVENDRITPIELIRTPKGETVIDFGQNMTGYVEVTIQGPRGSRVLFHHGEVLDRDGNFYNENYRLARNEMTYVLSGGKDVFKPAYSFQGFRYIRIEEYPFDEVDLNSFCAIAVHSEMARTGRFRCGNEKINQLYHNVIWGQKSNYLDIPTDCPQRNERLGWTGDTQVFCRTAAINYNVKKFLNKWMNDVALEQGKDGAVHGVVPDAPNARPKRISAAWGDCACIVPWEIYLAYGDKKLLARHFPTMKKWVDYLHSAGNEEFLWLQGLHYGDWLAMDAGEDSYVGATSNDLIASAFFAYSTELLIKAGEALGKDMSEYRTLHQNVRRAFRAYFMENGMPKEEFPFTEISVGGRAPVDTVRKGVTQTALTLILHFNLCNDDERPALAAKLVELIRDFDMRMTTGFVGTPYILHALSENGYTDVAYALLMQEKNPSWLYSVTHGATTMWEHWNSRKEDGTFWSTDMNSFNHYAYGAVYDWIFGVACGIKPLSPAYREVSIAPQPNKCLGFADTSIDTALGTLRAHWYYKGDDVYYEFEIPAGMTAHVTLPSGYKTLLTGGTFSLADKN